MRERILERFNQGDLARAYDLCQDGLHDSPGDIWLQHRAVLCLIRSGALERAATAYHDYRLAEVRHDEDCLGGEMDLEGANGFCGLRRGHKVNEGRGVIGVGIAVLADPVLELRVLHAMHLTPRTLALPAALPLLDECKHLLTTGFPLGLRS